MTNTTETIETINLYGEDGIAIWLTAEHDMVPAGDPEAVTKVIGHRLYAVSLEQARQSILEAYLVVKDVEAMDWSHACTSGVV